MKLLYSIYNKRALHVVCSYNSEEETTVVITAYEPSTDIWENDFKTREK